MSEKIEALRQQLLKHYWLDLGSDAGGEFDQLLDKLVAEAKKIGSEEFYQDVRHRLFVKGVQCGKTTSLLNTVKLMCREEVEAFSEDSVQHHPV